MGSDSDELPQLWPENHASRYWKIAPPGASARSRTDPAATDPTIVSGVPNIVADPPPPTVARSVVVAAHPRCPPVLDPVRAHAVAVACPRRRPPCGNLGCGERHCRRHTRGRRVDIVCHRRHRLRAALDIFRRRGALRCRRRALPRDQCGGAVWRARPTFRRLRSQTRLGWRSDGKTSVSQARDAGIGDIIIRRCAPLGNGSVSCPPSSTRSSWNSRTRTRRVTACSQATS